MSPLKEMITISINLENILRDQYGASGKGLREKAESVKYQLPEDTFRKISILARWRNKALHHNPDFAEEKIEVFRRIGKEVLRELKNNQQSFHSQTVRTSQPVYYYTPSQKNIKVDNFKDKLDRFGKNVVTIMWIIAIILFLIARLFDT